jgi:hypothetical protein
MKLLREVGRCNLLDYIRRKSARQEVISSAVLNKTKDNKENWREQIEQTKAIFFIFSIPRIII